MNVDLRRNQVLDYKSRGPSEGAGEAQAFGKSGLTPEGSRSGLDMFAQSQDKVGSVIQSAREDTVNHDYQLQIKNFGNIYKMQEDQSQRYQVENLRVSAT